MASHHSSRAPFRGRLATLLASATLLWSSIFAIDTVLTIQQASGAYDLRVGSSSLYYYGLEHSVNLGTFSVVDMALGSPAPTFRYTPANGDTRGFFRAQLIDIYSPGDADHDGIDDLWELQNNLAPLDPADALFPSAQDPGRTNLAYYRNVFGLQAVTEFYSVETSVLNSPFAISAETSIYNFTALTRTEAVSAEVSLFNFPPTSGFSVEAIAAEISVFNAAPVVLADHAISPEVTVFNSYSVQPPDHAISAEVSVFNDNTVQPALQTISNEVSILNNP